ncbi:hypothetical protein [Paenibacillus sp. 1P03SA]|uniref:hypothetical protein n=1 Tax=Paenibacillus sp. 1P03SA TaxID=3132294 RepID=UPI0039A05069
MQGKVKTGADRFPEMGPALLKGRKFGLLTNPTGINRDFQSTIKVSASLEGAETGRSVRLRARNSRGAPGRRPVRR